MKHPCFPNTNMKIKTNNMGVPSSLNLKFNYDEMSMIMESPKVMNKMWTFHVFFKK
jgi:hypothetical protein